MGNCKISTPGAGDQGKKNKRDFGRFSLEDKRHGKKVSFSSRTLDECDDEVETRTPKIASFIKKSLLSNGTFSQQISLHQITSDDMNVLVDAAQVTHFEPAERLILKYDPRCEYLYIVRRGIFRGLDNGKTNIIFREGDIIGETGFFYDCCQNLTVVAEGDDSSAYCLSRRDFTDIVEKERELKNIKLLGGLTPSQKCMLEETVTFVNYVRGDTILLEGELIKNFYIILSGLVRVVNTTCKQDIYYSVDFPMYPGAFFGEEFFLLNCSRSSRTFLAMKDVTVCVVDRALFESVEIFQPAIDQLVIEVATRLQEKKVQVKDDLSSLTVVSSDCCTATATATAIATDSNPIKRKKNKIRRPKRVLWKDSDSENEEETQSVISISMLKLPTCSCGLFP